MSGEEHIRASDYVRDRLCAEERKKADRHLLHCSRCRAEVERLRLKELGEGPGALRRFFENFLRGEITLLEPLLTRFPTRPPRPEGQEGFEPLRVLVPRVMGGVRGVASLAGRFGLVVALTVMVLLLPAPFGLSPEGHRALAAFAFTSSILALEPVSLPIAALMVPVVLVALGVATPDQAFETFSRPVVFLILASLFLAEALRKHGLTRRMALRTIVASKGRVGPLLLGLMSISAFFSMWVGNTGTAAMLIPVALTISKQLQEPEKARRLLVLLALGVAYSASLGGMVTIMGASANAVASGFLSQIRDWTFMDWMLYGLPSFLVIFPVTWFLLLKIVPVPVKELEVTQARQQSEKMGTMSGKEKEILLLLGGAAVLWVGGPAIEKALGLPSSLLSAAMVAVLAVSYLALRDIIDWEDLKGVSWGIFLIIGAGLSLGEALARTGVTEWFAGLIRPWISGSPFLITLIVLVLASALMTNILNNTTIAAVFVPILISLTHEDPAFNAVQLVLPVTLATTFGYSLPSASGRMALVASTGIIHKSEMLRYGLVVTVASSLLLALLFYVMALAGWV